MAGSIVGLPKGGLLQVYWQNFMRAQRKIPTPITLITTATIEGRWDFSNMDSIDIVFLSMQASLRLQLLPWVSVSSAENFSSVVVESVASILTLISIS